nr:MAG TPA: hypothetical protein [Caudoviricetes sp.]
MRCKNGASLVQNVRKIMKNSAPTSKHFFNSNHA